MKAGEVYPDKAICDILNTWEWKGQICKISKNICQRRGEYLWEDKKIFVSELGWWANSRIRKGASPTPCWLQTIWEIFMKNLLFYHYFQHCYIAIWNKFHRTDDKHPQMTSIVTHLSRKSVKIAKQTNCDESETSTQAFSSPIPLRWLIPHLHIAAKPTLLQ